MPEKKMMPHSTMQDVAARAGVSTATVSRVINGSDYVSEATRLKVLRACAELDYSLNPIAQSLRLGRTKTIAAILSFLTLPSIVERLRGVQAAMAESDCDLLTLSVGTPEARDAILEKYSQRARTDGVLIISMPVNDNHVKRFLNSGVPLVLIDAQHPELNRVNVDDETGGKMAAEHLIGLGHRKIGFISSYLKNPFQFSSTLARYKGYCEALESADIPVLRRYQREGEHGREYARDMALDLLSQPDPPTAIFASSDTKAIGVLDAAKELKIRVPEELSVIGYDNIRDAEYMNLTTIHQPLFDSGLEAGRKLLNMVHAPSSSPVEIILPLKLLKRGTTAPPGG
ncbi:MAG: LacI family DNA-binding transcriptional regulator [Anaerolineales bacterium]|nr:LacI family DNA-binding transcriptional regulator [Anaerolineales bacterium]